MTKKSGFEWDEEKDQLNRACSILDVEYVAPLSGFVVFVNDVYGCHYIMFDDMYEDIVVSHVGIVSFHMISVLLGEAIVAFYTGAKFL